MTAFETITSTDIQELKKLFTGKVRDIYEIDSKKWLIVTTDRISAFDVVFKDGIPDKGSILNRISKRWFSVLSVLNHIISINPADELPFLENYSGIPERSVIVKKVNRLPVECVVRGYLFGSVYEEYLKKGTAGGILLPAGLALSEKLSEPIFTPSTKAEVGHDENIDYKGFIDITGKDIGDKIIKASLDIYKKAAGIMFKKGVIIADTKFEFGLDENGELLLIDEVLTPDSSRYWDGAAYKTGESPVSFDKQFIRDYLTGIKWNKNPPPPELPEDIIIKTRKKYIQILDYIDSI